MRAQLAFILAIFLIFLPAQGQVKDTFIDPDHFNIALLEHLVKIRIDSVRHVNKLSRLGNDTLLYMAALDQGMYLLKKKEIGHIQNNKKKKNPMDRANYYGARYPMIGENVAKIYYLARMTMHKISKKEVFIRTYDEAAVEMVEGWVHSKPHYKNILTPGYDITGVAATINPKEKSIIGVQVFGMAPSSYQPHKNSKLFPYE